MSEPLQQLQLQEADHDPEWDHLVARSPQGGIFSQRRFLQALGCRYRLWQILERGKIVALIAAIESENGEDLVQFPFTPNQGLLFLHEAHSLPRQRVLDEYRIGEFALAALGGHYRNISMSLSWLVQDVRPFLWYNYHQPQSGQFNLSPRYTALLALQQHTENDIAMLARACRRQEMKKAAACKLSFEADIGDFLRLYTQTFARQDIMLDAATLDLVARITQAALAGGFGCLSSCSTGQGVACAYLFLYDEKRAYYLFAANDPAQRGSGAATRLMFENIYAARRRGLEEMDFVGVNSPNRGDFKLSFGPQLALYFDAHLRR